MSSSYFEKYKLIPYLSDKDPLLLDKLINLLKELPSYISTTNNVLLSELDDLFDLSPEFTQEVLSKIYPYFYNSSYQLAETKTYISARKDETIFASQILIPETNESFPAFVKQSQLSNLIGEMMIHLYAFYAINHQFIAPMFGLCNNIQGLLLKDTNTNRAISFHNFIQFQAKQRINSGDLTLAQMNLKQNFKILGQIVQGLVHLHDLNIIHRDFCSKNILIEEIDGEYKAYISDFGTSAFLINGSAYPSNPSTSSSDGYQIRNGATINLRFSAPELLKKFSKASPASDIWSCGIIMWQILSEGQCPFRHFNDIESLLSHILSGHRPTMESHWPNNVKEMLSKLWATDPKDRPSAKEFLALFETFDLNELDVVYKIANTTYSDYLPKYVRPSSLCDIL